MLDLEKAYDRVDHGWVFKILKKCNFGEEYISWVRLGNLSVMTLVAVFF